MGWLRRFAGGAKFGLLGTMAAFGAGAGLTWYFRATVFGWLTAPAGGALSPHDGLPVYTSLTEMMASTIRLSLHGGLVAAFPVAVFSIYYLARPALNRHQRRMVALFVPLIIGLFLAGNAFAYFVMLKAGVRYLIAFGDGIAVPTIRISEYMSIATAMIVWSGVIWQIPLVMWGLARTGIVSHRQFKKANRYVPWIALVFGAIITPTMDVVNMLLVAGPTYGLYLVGLIATSGKGRLVIRKLRAVGVGILRRIAVILILIPSLLAGLLYVTALSFVFVWDGHLSTEKPSRGTDGLDGIYMKALGVLARIARVSRKD